MARNDTFSINGREYPITDHTYDVVVEVRDVQHVMRILSALRASDSVVQAERL